VQAACHEQALRDADMFGPEFSPRGHPVFPADGDDPQGPLKMVRVDLHIGIIEINRQPFASFADVAERVKGADNAI
jgi:hypothetical protein